MFVIFITKVCRYIYLLITCYKDICLSTCTYFIFLNMKWILTVERAQVIQYFAGYDGSATRIFWGIFFFSPFSFKKNLEDDCGVQTVQVLKNYFGFSINCIVRYFVRVFCVNFVQENNLKEFGRLP